MAGTQKNSFLVFLSASNILSINETIMEYAKFCQGLGRLWNRTFGTGNNLGFLARNP